VKDEGDETVSDEANEAAERERFDAALGQMEGRGRPDLAKKWRTLVDGGTITAGLALTVFAGAKREAEDPFWLTKDFHILYRVTERLVADIDAEKVVDLNEAKAQLRRLLPAFEHCEAARLGSQMKRGS
jgi:hypothetical protein